tara:strand:+ start:2014 stop:3090 length:1077 start_codon:yes stop_codon:yes gene_type:complete
MATSFKTLLSEDVQQNRTKLHEAIPLTGTILSGTYGTFGAEENVKNYSHGMFQSVYDYPYLSSSANHILDLTVGLYSGIAGGEVLSPTQLNQKNDIYNEMAQMLCGYDSDGNIQRFDVSGAFGTSDASSRMNGVYFINFARLLTKDEIQKVNGGGFSLVLNAGSDLTPATIGDELITLTDTNATNALTNSPAGEYNVLWAASSDGEPTGVAAGLVFYQAGIAVVTSSVFNTPIATAARPMNPAAQNSTQLMVSGAISASCDALRRRVRNVSFNNTTELNSTIYFCRAGSNEFNYSSNPTYLNSSKIRVKDVSTDDPVSYITTVGLYGANNELLAVGKLSEPLKKTPADEYTLRVRLDY